MPTDAPLTADQRLDGADRHILHSDDELVRRWLNAQMRRQSHDKRYGVFLWAKVTEAFGVGSTSAKQICQRHGYNPDALVRKR